MREKWTSLVSHIANEHIDTHTMPRKMTIYLAAPPGDGLRIAREHFHIYVKPVLVAAAMDWDVIEGRKEGDVRFKTAERIRKKRKRAGEGKPMLQEDAETLLTVDAIRDNNGTKEYDGITGDLVVGRNTWKEYVRGMHEGWLGPVDAPKQPEAEAETPSEAEASHHAPGQSSLGDAAVKAAANTLVPQTSDSPTNGSGEVSQLQDLVNDDASPASDASEEKPSEQKNEEEEKPKPRHPPPYVEPTEYPLATQSPNTADLLGPSAVIRFPHILGFRNTPIRIYRFLTRRHLADSIGRDVAAAVLASYRPYSTTSTADETGALADSGDAPDLRKVLQHEERDWWKTTFQPRKEHEESVWIEDMVLDERIASRMRAFQLTAEDEDRAKRIAEGKEKVEKTFEDEES